MPCNQSQCQYPEIALLGVLAVLEQLALQTHYED